MYLVIRGPRYKVFQVGAAALTGLAAPVYGGDGMVIDAKFDKRQLAKAQRMIRGHPLNDPPKVIMPAMEKVSKRLARRVKRAAPVRSGNLKKSIKPLAKREKGIYSIGVRAMWYAAIVDYYQKYFTKNANKGRILGEIAREIAKDIE